MVQATTSDERGAQGRATVNVGQAERVLSVVGGGLLAIDGLRRLNPLAVLLTGLGAALIYRGVSGRCPLYQQLRMSTRRGSSPEDYFRSGLHVVEATTIRRPAREIYDLWRPLENLPLIMRHLRSVSAIDDRRSHWVADAPAGFEVEWDAEIIVDEPGRRISWRSLEGADVASSGTVEFLDRGAEVGTEVRVTLEYIPPAGKLGAAVARLMGEDPQTQIREDLGRLKQALESGSGLTQGAPPSTPCA